MSADDHKQALPQGFRLGPYRVVRVLGAGGFGVTYLCEHAGLGVQVAVKEYLPNEIAVRDGTEVHPKSAGDREGFEWGLSRFLDEARTLARFEHPNVVRVRDCFEANNTAYIVMDYEDGEPLDALLRRHGTLTEAQLKRVLLPVVDGLRQVHAAGFLHRDIKPANIYVRRSDESPVLLDFGSARQALGHKSRSLTAIASPGYSPPEQYEATAPQGAWTDIYALSALCYRAITGNTPMGAPWRQSELLRTQTDPLPRLAERQIASYSPAFLEAVDWGLRLIEMERPQSLDEWLPQLNGATTPRQSDASDARQANQPASPPTTRRTDKRKAGGAWLVIGLFLVVGLVWLASQWAGQVTVLPPKAVGQPFTVLVEPADAQVRILDLGSPYRAGMELQAGSYEVEASAPGHVTKTETVAHGTVPTVHRLTLSPLVTVVPEPPAPVSLDDEPGQEVGTADAAPGDAATNADCTVSGPFESEAEANAETARIIASGGQAEVVQEQAPPSSYMVYIEPAASESEAARTWRELRTRSIDAFVIPSGVRRNAVSVGVFSVREQAEAQRRRIAALGYAVAVHAPASTVHRVATGCIPVGSASRVQSDAQHDSAVQNDPGDRVPEGVDQAADWPRTAAEQGDPVAQYNLGLIYATGDGLPKDTGRAAVWFRKAAEQGHADAQYNLGLIYATGDGLPQDAGQAAVWYRKAAEQGDARAQAYLGSRYHFGRGGLPKDAVQAAIWYRKAAEQGFAMAQSQLGAMYQQGEGVPKDITEAATWSRKAAEQGIALAQYNLGLMYGRGEGVPKDASQAAVWFRKAAEQGDVKAQYNLGVRYAAGDGVPKDASQAAIWYRRAAEQGHTDAQYNLGLQYTAGDGVPKDASQAAVWFRKAAEQGDVKAQYNLGFRYAAGDGVPKDVSQAAIWYRRAAEQGLADAQHNLGLLYATGDGVPKDASQAAIWFRKAAEQGLADAQHNLGLLYATGDGVPKDASQAAIWWRKAAEQGLAEAQSNLGNLYAAGDGVPKDASQAAIWFGRAAEQGLAMAQAHLGLMYYVGNGVPADFSLAAHWFRKAAEQRVASAEFGLGLLYGAGLGVPEDAVQAAIWFRKAAEQGHTMAQFFLGQLYHQGEGVPSDVVQSYAWLNLAVAGGLEFARTLRATVAERMTRTQIADAQRLSRELSIDMTE